MVFLIEIKGKNSKNYNSQKSNADYASAKQMLEELGNYRDAKTRAKDAQNLMSMAKFLGTYREKYTKTFYAADGSVFNRTTGEDSSVITYSLDIHGLDFNGYGRKLTVDGNNLSFSYPDGSWKAKMNGDYIYITDTYDVNAGDIKYMVTNSTLQRIS